MRHAFVYEIVNLINSKRYIGSTIDTRRRWSVHLSALNRGKHHSLILQRAFNKYGISNFDFNIITCVINCDDMIKIEQEYLNLKPEYNMIYKAGSPRLGMKSSPEHCARMSKSLKGRSSPNKGLKFSEEHKAKMRASMKGIKRSPMTDEEKLKRSNSAKLYWTNKKHKV